MSAAAVTALDELRKIAAFQAEVARTKVAAVRRDLSGLEAKISQLSAKRSGDDVANQAAFDKWLEWRSHKLSELNGEVALLRARLAQVAREAGYAVAREEALSLLHQEQVAFDKRKRDGLRWEAMALQFLTDNVGD